MLLYNLFLALLSFLSLSALVFSKEKTPSYTVSGLSFFASNKARRSEWEKGRGLVYDERLYDFSD